MELLGAALDRAIWFLTRYWPALALGALALFLPFERWLPRIRIPRKTMVSAGLIVLVSLAATISAGLVGGLPLPLYQDDYSYLLSADTFLHGRLTNPPHPLWPHFETFYTLMEPTYSTKYPPAQGLFLALGRIVSGLALSGMWIAAALMSAAFYWMLRAWLPPRWSLAGGLACAIHPTSLEWSQSLHGGCVPALGGALLLGGLPRLVRQGRIRDGVAAGAGFALLLNSRPYEGGVLVLIALSMAAVKVWRGGKVHVPSATAGFVVAVLGASFTLAYNHAILGDPYQLPFRAYDERYASAPDFIWQQPYPERHYRHDDMRAQYATFRSYYLRERQPAEWLRSARARLKLMAKLVAPMPGGALHGMALLLFLPVIALPAAIRRREIAVAAGALLIFVAALLQVTWWTQSHYPSPAGPLAAFVYLSLARQLAIWQRRRRWGSRLVTMIAAVFIFVSAVSWYRTAHFTSGPRSAPGIRARIEHRLLREPGADLVIVSQRLHDLVFNDADIDRSPIVWAHELSDAENQRLMEYFRDRRVWRAKASETGFILEAVASQTSASPDRGFRPSAPRDR